MEFQEEKQVVRGFHARVIAAELDQLPSLLTEISSPDLIWRGFHPFGILDTPNAVATIFWHPLKSALTRLTFREDVFFAGSNRVTGQTGTWVVSMGHLMGLFDQPWLGIRPTGKLAMLRYCAFYRVDNGRIAETAMYFDIPHLMVQAGQNPCPDATAQHLVQPGPVTHTGLLYDPQPAKDGDATWAAIEAMITDLGTWSLGLPLEQELARTWHDDMLWWGPTGIGSTYTIARYAKQHSGPFRAAFSERSKTNHIARVAEGEFGGFFGWPNFKARLTGDFMGYPATGQMGEFRVIDIYRRAGDKLAENWVFIDLLHFWKGQGIDILGELSP